MSDDVLSGPIVCSLLAIFAICCTVAFWIFAKHGGLE